MPIARRPRKTSKVRSPRLKEYGCFGNTRIFDLQTLGFKNCRMCCLLGEICMFRKHSDLSFANIRILKFQNVLFSDRNMYFRKH